MHQSRGREAMSCSTQRRSNLDPLYSQPFALDVPLRDLLQTSLTPSFLAQGGLERIPYPSWGWVNEESVLRKNISSDNHIQDHLAGCIFVPRS